MLLGNNGRVWVHFDAPGNGPASWQLNTPLMRAHIGRPLRTARKVRGYLKRGVYRRGFSKGLVIVNPTSRTVVVHLRRPARLTTTGQQVTQVTATPFSGFVLTR
jgi:ribosomal protein S3